MCVCSEIWWFWILRERFCEWVFKFSKFCFSNPRFERNFEQVGVFDWKKQTVLRNEFFVALWCVYGGTIWGSEVGGVGELFFIYLNFLFVCCMGCICRRRSPSWKQFKKSTIYSVSSSPKFSKSRDVSYSKIFPSCPAHFQSRVEIVP